MSGGIVSGRADARAEKPALQNTKTGRDLRPEAPPRRADRSVLLDAGAETPALQNVEDAPAARADAKPAVQTADTIARRAAHA